MSDAWEREIVGLHEFFEAWLGGSAARTDESYARFMGVLHPSFTYVGPDGVLLERASLVEGLRAAHGSRPGLRIEIRKPRLLGESSDLVVATYEEWQTTDEVWSARLSTVVFGVDPAVGPHGVAWRHVHETWIDAEAPQ
jgi:hypothetical protein